MKCEHCYHSKVCKGSGIEIVADECEHFRDTEKIAELPCKPGNNLYIHYPKWRSPGNDSRDCCSECDVFEPIKEFCEPDFMNCRKGLYNTCPTVVKPIVAELFEVCEEGVTPCYYVDYEGNSQINDYYTSEEAAQKALEEGVQ